MDPALPAAFFDGRRFQALGRRGNPGWRRNRYQGATSICARTIVVIFDLSVSTPEAIWKLPGISLSLKSDGMSHAPAFEPTAIIAGIPVAEAILAVPPRQLLDYHGALLPGDHRRDRFGG
jgi:hypothetical protein